MVLRNHNSIASEPPISNTVNLVMTQNHTNPAPTPPGTLARYQNTAGSRQGLKNLNGSVVKSFSPAGRRKPTAFGKRQIVSKYWPKVLPPREFPDSQQRPVCLHPKHTVTNKLQKQETTVFNWISCLPFR